MKILLSGATGLIGSRFEELLFENHQIIPLSSSFGVDVTKKSTIEQYVRDKAFDIIIHLAGKTDVDACEDDKIKDMELLEATENALMDIDVNSIDSQLFEGLKSAYAINVIGTKNLFEVGCSYGKKFVYISSDFIFDGNGSYDEDSAPQPLNWYGMTKWYGEQLIDKEFNIVARLSFPYGYKSPVKADFVQKIVNLLKEREEVSLIEDQTITPTFIDDIVYGLDFLLSHNTTGIYHLTGSSSEDPYHIGQMIKEQLGVSAQIHPGIREEIYNGKAPRPFQSIMKNDKIVNLGYRPKTFGEGFSLIKSSL